jgi:hypothetical protein
MTTPARILRRSHLAHIARAEGVIRQFDDMCLTVAASRLRIQLDMRADRGRAQFATDSPAVTRTRTRNHTSVVHRRA